MFARIGVMVSTLAVLALPGTAWAYVGPGAGLSLLGALWALLLAIGTALFFVAAWPLRRMLKRRRAARAAGQEAATGAPYDRSRGPEVPEPQPRNHLEDHETGDPPRSPRGR